MQNIIQQYTFNATSKTVTFIDVVPSLERILLIANVTTNTIIYVPSIAGKGGTLSGNVLTLVFNTTSMSNADVLQIIYDDLSKVLLRDDFPGAVLDTTKWTSSIGTGGGITVGTSAVTITTGTTVSSATSIISKKSFTHRFQVIVTARLSQRIANQNFYIELVTANGVSYARYNLSGTVATTGSVETQHESTSGGNTAISTLTTASNQCFEIYVSDQNIIFETRNVNTNETSTFRAIRNITIPDLSIPLFIKLSVVNGGTAPASTTSFIIENIIVQEEETMNVEIIGGGGRIALNEALPVVVANTAPVTQSGTWTVQPGNTANTTPWLVSDRASATGGLILYKLLSAATTNSNLIASGARAIYGIQAFNTSASTKFLKLYNKATAPTVGTDTVVKTIPLPAGVLVAVQSSKPLTFSLGLGIGITSAIADSDTTAVALNDVVVNIDYI